MRDLLRKETKGSRVKLNTILMSLSVGLPLLTGSAAQAAISVFTDQSLFLAALTSTGVDTFENVSITGSTPSPLIRAAGTFGYTATTGSNTFFGAGSGSDHWLSTNAVTVNITFSSFTGGVSALGGFFFNTDNGGSFTAGDIFLNMTDSTSSLALTIVGATTTNFRGFVSDGTMTSFTVAPPPAVFPSGTWATVNNLVLGNVQSVPEPGTFALLGGGIALIGAMRRRVRAQ
jgi:hypothetical protein